MWDWVGSKLPHYLCFVDQPANHSSLFPLSVFSAAGCHRSDSVHWDGTEQWGWVREGNHAGEAAKPNTTTQKPLQLHRLTRPCSSCPPDSPLRPLHLPLVKSVTAARTTPPCQVSMATPFLWKLSSQKLGFFLVSFGFIWGMMLLHFTIQQRASHENSAVLRQQILDLSKRYIKALAEENQSVMDGPYVGTMTAYGEWQKVIVIVIVLVCLPHQRGQQAAPVAVTHRS